VRFLLIRWLEALIRWLQPSSRTLLGLRADAIQYGAMYIVKVSVDPEHAGPFFDQVEFHLSMMGRPQFVPKIGASPSRRYFGPTADEHEAEVAVQLYRSFADDHYKN